MAGYGHREESCFKEVYKEEYVPGTKSRPGFVRSSTKLVEIPCRNRQSSHPVPSQPRAAKPPVVPSDTNSCIEGSVLGGIAGGGIGAAASRGNGRLWAIPLGIVGGALVGCQIDGG